MLDKARLDRRKQGRHDAGSVVELLALGTERMHPDRFAAFVDELRDRLLDTSVVACSAIDQPVTSEQQLSELAGTTLEFGKYNGYSFEQVAKHEPQYLAWLCDNSKRLYEDLATYLDAAGIVAEG